ncbi:hypothetical protein [Streptomyces sp. NBC_01320]|uniref:hypothetical protein n=1 Tax=Streptomyces sp. NBC_01320 TaxID=2903824 RepID=UPI002E10EF6E|nr:hypothetical protein OG395_26335 [Streptomyces sp. NBC_01320]
MTAAALVQFRDRPCLPHEEAAAHVAALDRFDALLPGTDGSRSTVINVGTGTGTTVRELLTAFNSVNDTPVSSVDVDARPGDVAGAYTRSERAHRLLDWQPQHSVTEGIRHSLRWAAVREAVLRP